jgi:hypothetical protein
VSGVQQTAPDYARRHLRFGWCSLLAFATLGLILEVLHGFKVAAYLDVSNQTRRLMWTLAHAHGSLLALVHVVFGLTVRVFPDIAEDSRAMVSWCLMGASVFLPGGFFLGGVVFYGGDPGVAVALVPAGAVCLLIALLLLARVRWSRAEPGPDRGKADTGGQRRRRE